MMSDARESKPMISESKPPPPRKISSSEFRAIKKHAVQVVDESVDYSDRVCREFLEDFRDVDDDPESVSAVHRHDELLKK